jgi:hypothetical protein
MQAEVTILQTSRDDRKQTGAAIALEPDEPPVKRAGFSYVAVARRAAEALVTSLAGSMGDFPS